MRYDKVEPRSINAYTICEKMDNVSINTLGEDLKFYLSARAYVQFCTLIEQAATLTPLQKTL